jgi:uncharacterized membrane protein YdbT with pleckstrin-like domain
VRAYLEPGELVRIESRPHGVALAAPLLHSLLFAAAGAVLLLFGTRVSWVLGAPGAAALLVGAFLAFRAVLWWDRTKLVLTTEKLFVVYGVVRRRAAAVHLRRVGPIEVEQSLLGRLLGYGTVVAGELEIPYVPQPRDVCRLAR